jgi:hypothetical protein
VHRTTLAVLLVFIILSLLITYPLPVHLGTAVEDRQDALLNVWIMAWDGHQLLADPLHLFDANIFYPYRRTLAYSELLLGNALLALPLTAASGNPVLGYNVVLLLSFVLSALGAYLLVLRLSGSWTAGLVAGPAYAFSAYRLTNLAQAQLLTAQWIPFALLALYGLLRRPGPRPAAALVLFFWLQAVSSFYYAMLLGLALAGLVVFEGLSLGPKRARAGAPDPEPGARSPARGRRGAVVVPLLLAGGFCLLALLPFALPYFRVQRELGFERSLADNEPFSASLIQYAMVPPNSLLHSGWLPNDDRPIAGGYPVDALFPGLSVLALAAWGLLRGRGRPRWFFFLLLLTALILSFGPRLYLAPGKPAGLDLALPYAWLYALVPGFKALRAPVRFDALVSLSLAVLAGYGLAALVRWTPWGRRLPSLLAAGCALLIVLESTAWPAARAEPVPVGGQLPPVVRWLALQAPEGPILELPMAFTPGGPQLDYQYLSTYHWRPTPDGYSGFVPPAHGQIVYEMERFPSERSVSLLQALDVRLVVLHGGRLGEERLAELQAALAAVPEMTPVAAFDAVPIREGSTEPGTERDLVYAVSPAAFDPGGLLVSVYFPPMALTGQLYTAYLIAVNPGPRSFALPPTAAPRPTFGWQREGGEPAGQGTAVAAGLPLVTSPQGGTAVVALTLHPPTGEGLFRLTLGEEDGPLGTWQAEAEVRVDYVASQDLPVPARLESWVHPSTVRAGSDLPVSLTWRALGKIDAYYSVYLKLLDDQDNALASWDGEPGGGGAPTLLWVPGETIDDLVSLPVAAETPPGEYRLVAGMYRAADLARCLTLGVDGQLIPEILLGTVRVEP